MTFSRADWPAYSIWLIYIHWWPNMWMTLKLKQHNNFFKHTLFQYFYILSSATHGPFLKLGIGGWCWYFTIFRGPGWSRRFGQQAHFHVHSSAVVIDLHNCWAINWCDNPHVRLSKILYINNNDFHNLGRSQMCAGACYVFRTSKPHSRTLCTVLYHHF